MANQPKRFVSVASRRTGLPGDDGDPRRVRETTIETIDCTPTRRIQWLRD